ncbi:MAG: nucleotide-binding protein [Phycisphaerales bacterium]|nr:nucleotide-binding protein [Phycisphaerales bacterium]
MAHFELKDLIHQKGLTRWDQVALALAAEYPSGADTQTLKTRLSDAGLKGVKKLNIAAILSRRPETIASTKDGWEFVGSGYSVLMERTGIEAAPAGMPEQRALLADRESDPDSSVVFIGHGGSTIWREFKDFLVDRLDLEWEEFNRTPQAGRTTTARLTELLDRCRFAFIIMTAEDEQPDRKMRARQNVVHEAGLFQGKLGFNRAIVLLEEGCEEFSNIHGLTHIPFPAGKVSACFEEVRRTLEREAII